LRRENRTSLHALLIGGYLLIWASFGVVAHLLDQTLHWQLGNWTWFAMHPRAPAAAVLAVAGAFQFSRLKYRCLDKCRTPLNFIMSHWHGPRPAWESFNLGVAHGVYCVGCCWALMLLMFVVGTGNIGWMLALGLLLVAKKSSLGPLDRRAAGREFANVGGTDHSHRHRDDSGLN
jgi:predicted metal-binding membrane protein